jgi:hypothetical protein
MLNAGISLSGQHLTESIRQRAYEIWLSEGCPDGRDRIHWLRAEAEVREKFNEAHSRRCKAGFHERPPNTRGKGLERKRGAQSMKCNQEAAK